MRIIFRDNFLFEIAEKRNKTIMKGPGKPRNIQGA